MLVIAHPALAEARELAKVLSKFGRANEEDGMVVLDTRAVHEIAGTFGVVRVSIAIECENQLGAISKAIVQVGKKTVMPGQSFDVQVHMTKEQNFTSRDVEFAATAALAAELGKPAREQAQKTITAYVGKRAFVAVREYEGAGGAIAGSQGSTGCALSSPQSLAACLAAARAGFVVEPILLYNDDDNLRANALQARALAEKTGAKKQELEIVRVRATGPLALDMAAAKALVRAKSRYVVLPVSLATHPKWFIETAVSLVHDAGKLPLTPLMFSENTDAWKDLRKTPRKRIDVKLAKPRRVRLEVGPNYLHDVVDSV